MFLKYDCSFPVKFHRDCPIVGPWHAALGRDFRSEAEAIAAVGNRKQKGTFRCHYCGKVSSYQKPVRIIRKTKSVQSATTQFPTSYLSFLLFLTWYSITTSLFIPFLIPSSRYFQLRHEPKRSIGEGNLFHNVCPRVSSDESSLVKWLTSRSLTERGLQIHVHQNFGYTLQLIWYVTNNGKTTKRCMERVFD